MNSVSLGTDEVTIASTNAIEMTAPVFCSIVRAPAAIPRRCVGTVPIIAAVFGQLNMPEPTPTMNSHSAARSRPCRRCSVVIAASASAVTSMPQRGQRARAAAVGPDPGQRRGDQHPDRHRRELDARDDRVVALDALEVEDEHEHQREARQAVDERRRGGGREQPVLEDRQVEHRRRVMALDQHEQRQQHRRRRRCCRASAASVQPLRPARGDPVDERRSGRAGRSSRRATSKPRSWSGLASSRRIMHAHSEPDSRERDVEPEHPVPGDRRPARRRAPGR